MTMVSMNFLFRVVNIGSILLKSLALFEELIKKHSNPGDIVIDTFMGSGTTARAAKNTGRNFFGTELNKKHTSINSLNY